MIRNGFDSEITGNEQRRLAISIIPVVPRTILEILVVTACKRKPAIFVILRQVEGHERRHVP